MSETVQVTSARVYANAGWKVFPIWWTTQGRCACPAGDTCTSPGKHPLTQRGVHGASDAPGQVANWWQTWPLANIGVPAGANDLAVLDVDPAHGGATSLARLHADLAARGLVLPTTLTAVTGGGGLHLYYAAPAGGVKTGSNVFGRQAPGLDTRGRGGYVVAPPSVHASGRAYAWLNSYIGTDVAPWPAVLSGLMSAAEGR